MDYRTVKLEEWTYYFNAERQRELRTNKCGKWMYFFDSSEKGIGFAKTICERAVREGAAIEAKHTTVEMVLTLGSGVCCFYCDGDDVKAHKRVLTFLLENGMVSKTKTGKLYNISFKFDTQTHNGEYGPEFASKIKLSDFVDLATGAWLDVATI